MKGNVRIYPMVFGDYVDPIATFDVENLRVRMRDSHRAGRTCDIMSRLIHEDGSYATDFEHDGASAFTMEFAVLDMTILSEDWVEVVGMLTAVRSWEAPFIRDPDATKTGGPWEGAHLCPSCTEGKPGDETGPHWIVEHYTPPECSGIKSAKGKSLPIYGRYIVVRWGWS